METFLIRLLQFILAISLLVLLHEGGHCSLRSFLAFALRSSSYSLMWVSVSGKVNSSVGNLRKTIRNMVWVGCHWVATVRSLV